MTTDETLKTQEKELKEHFEKFWETVSKDFVNGNISAKEFGYMLFERCAKLKT